MVRDENPKMTKRLSAGGKISAALLLISAVYIFRESPYYMQVQLFLYQGAVWLVPILGLIFVFVGHRLRWINRRRSVQIKDRFPGFLLFIGYGILFLVAVIFYIGYLFWSGVDQKFNDRHSGPSIKFSAQTSLNDIPVLFPEEPAEVVNMRAKDEFGEFYCRTLEYIATDPTIVGLLGKILELRPARGQNEATNWLDPSAEFLLKVVGEKGPALVKFRKMNAVRTIHLIYNGEVIDIPQRYFDWNGPDRKEGQYSDHCSPTH